MNGPGPGTGPELDNCQVLNLGEGGKIVLNRKMQGYKSGGQRQVEIVTSCL